MKLRTFLQCSAPESDLRVTPLKSINQQLSDYPGRQAQHSRVSPTSDTTCDPASRPPKAARAMECRLRWRVDSRSEDGLLPAPRIAWRDMRTLRRVRVDATLCHAHRSLLREPSHASSTRPKIRGRIFPSAQERIARSPESGSPSVPIR